MSTTRMMLSVAAGFLIGCGPAADRPAPMGADLARLMPPAASLEGWSAAEGPLPYDADTLYEYMDGGAERYLGYGFRCLAHGRYQLGDDPLASVTLDVYDMAGKLGAFGIYRSVRPPDAEPRPWCAESFRAATVMAAWKANVYVHCAADDDRPELIAMAERLMQQVCEAIAGDSTLPAILDPLPPGGLVPSSERYVASDLLGHAFLPGGVVAAYEIDGGNAELFFSDLGSEAAAVNAIAALRAHHSQWGEIVGELSAPGDGGFEATDPTLGSVSMIRAGRCVAGVHGDLAPDTGDRLLTELVNLLLSPDSPSSSAR